MFRRTMMVLMLLGVLLPVAVPAGAFPLTAEEGPAGPVTGPDLLDLLWGWLGFGPRVSESCTGSTAGTDRGPGMDPDGTPLLSTQTTTATGTGTTTDTQRGPGMDPDGTP